MGTAGKKVAVLIEADYYENEIFYYQHRFVEEGIELHFLSRLWGNPRLTFLGHEYRAPLECSESFEGMTDAQLDGYAAVIVPSGVVADRLRYTEDVARRRRRRSFWRGRSPGRESSRASSATGSGCAPRGRSWSGAGG